MGIIMGPLPWGPRLARDWMPRGSPEGCLWGPPGRGARWGSCPGSRPPMRPVGGRPRDCRCLCIICSCSTFGGPWGLTGGPSWDRMWPSWMAPNPGGGPWWSGRGPRGPRGPIGPACGPFGPMSGPWCPDGGPWCPVGGPRRLASRSSALMAPAMVGGPGGFGAIRLPSSAERSIGGCPGGPGGSWGLLASCGGLGSGPWPPRPARAANAPMSKLSPEAWRGPGRGIRGRWGPDNRGLLGGRPWGGPWCWP